MKSNIALIVVLGLLFACASPTNENQAEQESEEYSEAITEINITGEEVVYEADSSSLIGFIAYDKARAEKKPGILVVHEWWGHNDYTRKRAEMLAELGYVAFALDMYGDGQTAEHPTDAGKFAGMVMRNEDLAVARFNAAYELLASHPEVDPDKISAIGYCFGGSVVQNMANIGYELDGIAAFHSGVQVPNPPSDRLKAKVLVQNGADDPMVSPESVQAFKRSMDSLKVDYEYVEFPGVVHAYTNPGATELGEKFNLPLKYDEEADSKSWENLREFLSDIYPNN